MKRALRFLRNIFLVVLAVGLCAAGAVAFQGYKLYTSALEEMPLYKRVEQVRQQLISPPWKACPPPTGTLWWQRRITGFTPTAALTCWQ